MKNFRRSFVSPTISALGLFLLLGLAPQLAHAQTDKSTPEKCKVEITSLKDGDKVGESTTVKGKPIYRLTAIYGF